jgi:hypothetical protein
MKKSHLIFYILFIFAAFSNKVISAESITWGKAGFLNIDIIEETASKYILESLPELKGVQVKMLHVRVRYNSPNDFYLLATFAHDRSFKNVKDHDALEDWKSYGLNYYMETIDVEFDKDGKPLNLNLNEVALSIQKEKAMAEFQHHFNSN